MVKPEYRRIGSGAWRAGRPDSQIPSLGPLFSELGSIRNVSRRLKSVLHGRLGFC